MSTKLPKKSENGSVYLITLVTVTAIVSLVLIGTRARMMMQEHSQVVRSMSSSSSELNSASELALETIRSDKKWANTATTGIVFSNQELDGMTMGSIVTDADTGVNPIKTTSTYRVQTTVMNGPIKSTSSFDVELGKADYTGYLKDLGALHYWPLGEATGESTARDEIGVAHGTYLDTSVPGSESNEEDGLVPEFSDSSDHVTIPFQADYVAENGSISFWACFHGSSMSGASLMMGVRYDRGPLAFGLGTMKSCISAYLGEDVFTGFGDELIYTPKNSYKANIWTHIAFTWGANGLAVYVDGDEIARERDNTFGFMTSSSYSVGDESLLIGGGPYLLNPSTIDGFNGQISHVAFLNVDLTDDQISNLATIKPDLKSYRVVENSWNQIIQD